MKIAIFSLSLLLVGLGWVSPARAAPVRILIAAGASSGLATDRPLLHPRDDAAGVRDVLTALGGVRRDETIFLPEVTKESLLGALDRANAIARSHPANEVTVIVYFSGHGDHEALHIHGESLTNAELSARVSAIPAALRIVVIDACRTTDLARPKGMTVGPGFAVSLSAQSATTGTAWFYASADGEAAQESDEIGGAIFTHFWLAGLRGAGDSNGDGRVTLDESFAYAYTQTLLRSARSGGVLQRPEAKLALTESSPFVVTELAGERAQLEFPRDPDALYLVYAVGAQSVVAEVYGLPDRAVRIVLAKGRYIVQKRIGTRGAAVEIVLRGGETHALLSQDFRAFQAETLAQKGGMVVRPWSLEVVDSVMTGHEIDIENDVAFHVARRETYGYALGPVVGFGKRTTPYNDVRELFVGGEAALDRFFSVAPPLLFRVGVDVRGEWISQDVRRSDADRAALGGFHPSAHYSGSALGGGAHLGARLLLGSPLYLDLGARALAQGMPTSTGIEVRPLLGLSVAVGVSL